MTEQRRKKKTPASIPQHVFIAQEPKSFQQDHSRLVSSQARRFQSASKRQQQRLAAKSDAGYAQSLVGWTSISPTPSAEVRKRASVSPSNKRSPKTLLLAREFEEGETSEVNIHLSIRTGIRSDPFNAFPSSNTKGVMLQVDYYIHVWAPHKAGNFDDLMGYNTQLDLCWPLALQDDMLFDATVAVSRTALVLAQGKDPTKDEFILDHTRLALNSLRQKLCALRLGSREAVLFTMGRMISIAYMSGYPEAFMAHFDAFSKLAQKYIDERPHSDVAQVLGNRLDSWKALNGYRTGQNVLRKSRWPTARTSPLRHHTPSEGRMGMRSSALSHGVNISMDMAQYTQQLIQSLRQTLGTGGTRSNPNLELAEWAQGFGDIIYSAEDLTSVDLQLCCALMAFCQQLLGHLDSTRDVEATKNDNDVLDAIFHPNEIAKTFLYQKLDGFYDSDEQKMVLTWSALVLGSFLLRQADHGLRTKGHIIHVNLSLHLGLGGARHLPDLDANEEEEYDEGWYTIELLLAGREEIGYLWHPNLVPLWRRDWQGSMKRQRRWEKQGVWMIGAPRRLLRHGGTNRSASAGRSDQSLFGSPGVPATVRERYGDVDIIEYLVLREARDSLPRVE